MYLTYSIIGFESKDGRIFKELMSMFPQFHFNGTITEFDNGLNHILKESPSIVFLDIDNREVFGDSFYFIKEVEQFLNKMPHFIAVSSSKQMAYEVIKSNFIDYLLKPFSEFELRKTLFRIKKNAEVETRDKICLKSFSDYRFVELDKILFLQADNNTTDFYLSNNNQIPAFKTLKYYESILPDNFLRVHNSFLVNTDHITRINFGKSLLYLDGGMHDIPFSRTYKSEVELLKSSLFEVHSLQA